MNLISLEDRAYIENKYHLQDGPFDPLNRFAYHGYEYDPSTGLDDSAMHEGLCRIYEETRGLPHAVAKAKGFAFVLDNARINVSPNDYFFGFYNWDRPLEGPFISRLNNMTKKEQDAYILRSKSFN